MSRTITLALLHALLVPAAALAFTGSASTKSSARLPLKYDEAVDFFTSNRAEILQAANCTIIEDRGGGEFLLETKTPLGAIRYVVRESIERGAKQSVIRMPMTEFISGPVTTTEQLILIELTPAKSGIDVTVSVDSSARYVPGRVLKIGQQESVFGCLRYLRREVR